MGWNRWLHNAEPNTAAPTTPDFSTITELPGSLLNAQQRGRIEQRYRLGAELARGRRVLEVSCGAGVGLGMVQLEAVWLVGCDLTYPVLALAQQHYGQRIPLVDCDAQQLPFADASFDLLLSFEAIYYLPQSDRFLREARRLLRPNGRLLIGTSNPDWPYFVPGAQSVDYPDVPTLAAQLQRVGFQQTECWGALPLGATSAPRQEFIASVRRLSQRISLLKTDTPLSQWLKRLTYGRLSPLPSELPSQVTIDPHHDLTAIDPSQRDHNHRVIFLLANCPK